MTGVDDSSRYDRVATSNGPGGAARHPAQSRPDQQSQQKRNPMEKFRLPIVGAVLVAAAGTGLAVSAQPGAAVSSYSPPVVLLHQQDTAVLNPDGTVTVTVAARCPAPQIAHLFVTMSQRVGDAVVTGYAFQGVRCDDTRQTFAMTVTPQNGVFTAGSAWSEPSLACGGCDENDEHEITVVG